MPIKKDKAFDCVEMKREAQRQLREEYEARHGEFSSFAAFIRARAQESAARRAPEGPASGQN